jgi:hypothetical protein
MLDNSAAISATGKLHIRGVKINNTTAQPGPTALTSGSRPYAPPETVKKITPTSEIKLNRLVGGRFIIRLMLKG